MTRRVLHEYSTDRRRTLPRGYRYVGGTWHWGLIRDYLGEMELVSACIAKVGVVGIAECVSVLDA